MAKLKLSFISGVNERVAPLLDGRVEIEGLELIVTRSDPSETFWRQLSFNEFEISEMSIASFLIAKSRGADMVAVPVFPWRRYMHTELHYNVDSGIRTASDLKGKRVGVGEYQQSSAVWTRGILQHDFGVSQFDIHWYMERSEAFSHGGPTGFQPPKGISFQRIPPDKSLASMLVNGELDVAPTHRAFSKTANIIDRSTQIRARDGDWSKVKPLFPDRMEEGRRFQEKHGFIPANHLYAIRGDIYRQHPWIAFNLYKAFAAAKELAAAEVSETIPSALIFGSDYLAMTKRIFGPDPFPYGIAANRKMLDTISGFLLEQGLTASKMEWRDIFAESTLEL